MQPHVVWCFFWSACDEHSLFCRAVGSKAGNEVDKSIQQVEAVEAYRSSTTIVCVCAVAACKMVCLCVCVCVCLCCLQKPSGSLRHAAGRAASSSCLVSRGQLIFCRRAHLCGTDLSRHCVTQAAAPDPCILLAFLVGDAGRAGVWVPRQNVCVHRGLYGDR